MATIDLNHDTICINPTDDLTLYDKNLIMSRIEKFLFAICSLDSSDLPIPLSRIEELYYCLVTGDTPPTFEPLSRAEKFLMACLGVYNVNKLPKPLSRSEVLLKKIATGDSNLEDVDNLQSKYEFLLAYIIQNGGIDDFDEYDLNTQFSTLYNTKERPIKSAILKGNTLVNIVPSYVIDYTATNDWDGFNGLTQPSNPKGYSWKALQDVKPNTKYFISCYVETFDVDGNGYYINNRDNQTIFSDSLQVDGAGLYKWIVTSKSELTDETYFILRCQNGHARGTIKIKDFMIIEYQDGMENWDIPYFEGMASVKMPVLTTTGKNLFNADMLTLGGNNYASNTQFLPYDKNLTRAVLKKNNLIEVKPNSTLTLSCDSRFKLVMQEYDENEIRTMPGDKGWHTNGYQTLTVGANTKKVNLYFTKQDPHSETNITSEEFEVLKNSIQLEESSTVTTYEPYKSNILTSGKMFTQSMFEQGSFKESTPLATKPYDDIKINLSENSTYYSNRIRTITTHKVIPGASYKVKINDGYGIFIGFCRNGLYSNLFNREWTDTNTTVTIPTDCDEMFFAIRKIDNSDITVEDYPAMGLEIRQEVTLRGIGKVKDELNLLTGELTERICEIYVDGTQNYSHHKSDDNFYCIRIPVDKKPIITKDSEITVVSDKIKTIIYDDYYNLRDSGITIYKGVDTEVKTLYLSFKKSELDTSGTFIQGVKKWLSENPITVQYPLATESIKTVDLSVVDQDGNDTKLSTFNDITHVTLSSEGLIPEAELEVATKNKEDLEDSSVYTVHTLNTQFNTLYNTKEKPIKSAISKGNTLVNLNSSGQTKTSTTNSCDFIMTYLKPNTSYTVMFEVDYDTTESIGVFGFLTPDKTGWNTGKSYTGKGFYKELLTTNSSNDLGVTFRLRRNVAEGNFTVSNVIVLEGDYTNINIPYFTGMSSVKMPVLTAIGKNLFDGELENGYIDIDTGQLLQTTTHSRTRNFISVDTSTITISKPTTTEWDLWILQYDLNKQYIGYGVYQGIATSLLCKTIELLNHTKYIKFYTTRPLTPDFNLMIEEGSVATTYEPFKSNILTTLEEVELRGIGDVRDELDLITGEVTQRIGKVVLDGYSSIETWTINNTGNPELITFAIPNVKLDFVDHAYTQAYCSLNSDKFNVDYDYANNRCILTHNDTNADIKWLVITVKRTELSTLDVAGFRSYLNLNPVTVQYQLATPIVKTVDLSIIDQDGNDTKLSTFNDITHVTLSSEGLIPEAELEVAEKVPEIAASILTISREQEVIDSATNKQSENVDATMIATTEIYEGLL